MTIKMSDVFELPMIDHGRNNLATDHRDETEAAIIAINAYDANQERIAELEGFAVEANSCVGLQRTKIDEQQQEIEDQKRKLDDKAKLIKGVDEANSQMSEEIACLKKQISQLKSEHESMAAYADQRINMLTRVNNKLREGKS